MSGRIAQYRTVETKKRNLLPNARKTNPQNCKESPIQRVLFLQKTIGNRAVGKLIGMGTLSFDRFVQALPERKPPGTDVEDDEFAEREPVIKPPVSCPRCRDDVPHQGSATIVCDGNGGYRVDMGWAATATCGIPDCVRRHEQSHITDWQGRWPNGCRNADGSNKPDGTAVPTGGPGYNTFLRNSECKAYRDVEIPCEEALLGAASPECRPVVQNVLDDSRRQRSTYCGR